MVVLPDPLGFASMRDARGDGSDPRDDEMQAKAMDFTKLFRESHIILDLDSADKEPLLSEILEKLVTNGVLSEETTKEVLSLLLKRESLGSTGIGNSVAIPHAKLKGLDRAVAAVARSTVGVDYNSVDGEPVNIIFLILSPAEDAESHVSILKWVSTIARHADFRRFFLRAKTNAEAVALIEEMAEELF